MDPITHGLTGALIGKAFFAGRYDLAPDGAGRGHLAVFAATAGAVFPDLDLLLGPLTRNDLAIIELHRGVTHSFLCLPVFALLLAALTREYARRRGRKTPSWGALSLIYGLGIASHILLDLITSFGTMIWSPWQHTRVQWDLVFIVDFAMSAIVLLPQVAAHVYREREGSLVRAARAWGLFTLLALAVKGLLEATGFPISLRTVAVASLLFAALFFLPGWRGWGLHVRRATWARAALLALLAYLSLCAAAHQAALRRVEQFAASQHLRVEQLGALPLPPSAAHWVGLIRTLEGVYEARLDLLSHNPGRESPAFRFLADAAPNGYIEAARQLPRVQTYLWFARFPVYRFAVQNGRKVVEISDLRFFGRRARPSPFTFRVTFDAAGRVIGQGLATGVR